MNMEQKVKEIMSNIFGIPISRISDESSPETLNEWDSIKHLNLIVALEEEFAVEFDDIEIGMTKSEIEEILGSPDMFKTSSTAPITYVNGVQVYTEVEESKKNNVWVYFEDPDSVIGVSVKATEALGGKAKTYTFENDILIQKRTEFIQLN